MSAGSEEAREPLLRRSVLVVDDDDDLRLTMCDVLSHAGFLPIPISGGAEALAYLRTSPPPALILLDLMMSGMDGWGFREQQLMDPHLADIPVVVITASRDHRRRPIQADGILFKPVLLDRMLAVVQRWVSLSTSTLP